MNNKENNAKLIEIKKKLESDYKWLSAFAMYDEIEKLDMPKGLWKYLEEQFPLYYSTEAKETDEIRNQYDQENLMIKKLRAFARIKLFKAVAYALTNDYRNIFDNDWMKERNSLNYLSEKVINSDKERMENRLDEISQELKELKDKDKKEEIEKEIENNK